MKKKLKELTIEETINICKKQYECRSCPLVDICSIAPALLVHQCKKDLEKEIEL